MDDTQRQKTGSELNSAILSSQSQPSESKLPLLLKTMLWSQEQLVAKGAKAHPRVFLDSNGDLAEIASRSESGVITFSKIQGSDPAGTEETTMET